MTPTIKRRVLQEIELIPEDKLADLYKILHYFRLGLEKAHSASYPVGDPYNGPQKLDTKKAEKCPIMEK